MLFAMYLLFIIEAIKKTQWPKSAEFFAKNFGAWV